MSTLIFPHKITWNQPDLAISKIEKDNGCHIELNEQTFTYYKSLIVKDEGHQQSFGLNHKWTFKRRNISGIGVQWQDDNGVWAVYIEVSGTNADLAIHFKDSKEATKMEKTLIEYMLNW